MSYGFSFFNVIFLFAVIAVLSVIGISIVQRFAQRSRDAGAPQESCPARVVAKRTEVTGGGEFQARTGYYVTFENEQGGRLELRLEGVEYGLLAEGDAGLLYYQGSKYIAFERKLGAESGRIA